MSTAPDSDDILNVRMRSPRQGSCLSPQLAKEIETSLEVSLKQSNNQTSVPLISNQVDNLASLDGDNGIYVPAGSLHTETQTWLAANPAKVTFKAFAANQIDATKALLSFYWIPGSAEAGTAVLKDPSGTATIRPTVEVSSVTSGVVEFQVYNATSDISITLQLFVPAIPPQQA